MRRHLFLTALGIITMAGALPAPAQAQEPYKIGMTAAITGRFSAGYQAHQ